MVDTNKEFIRKYSIAQKLGWTREQFAELMKINPNSVRKRLHKIKTKTGVTLHKLPIGDGIISPDMRDKFSKMYNNLSEKEHGKTKNSKVYLITSAQNATPINMGFFNSCLTFCKHRSAEFIVIPYRYKNPTSVWSQSNKADEWWADPLTPYIHDTKLELCSNLIALAHIKIQPTASEPIDGFEAHTGTASAILGHPKVQFKSVPTINSNKPKILLSTGAITEPNYTDSKAGWKGNFHHSIAAVVVEVDEDQTFHVRHVHASDKSGAFYDLNKKYTATGVINDQKISALITGDTHAEFMDDTVEKLTYTNVDSIMKLLKPEYVILHDLNDFYARNHHHKFNDLLSVGKHRFGRNNVQDGLQECADFIDRISNNDTKIVIVKSNHDEAFDRWLKEADPKSDPENAQFYHYMKYHQLNSIKINQTNTGFYSFDPFKFWCFNPENNKGLKNKNNTLFLDRNSTFQVNNIELSFHGDVGVNGSRGDIKSLSKLSNKMVIGHSHTPGIYEGCYQVGMSAKTNLEYKQGPSSWMQTHCIIYPDGKRTLINIINGKWHGT